MECVAIEPVHNYIRLELNVGHQCNYRCPYCIEKSNWNKSKWISWPHLKKFLQEMIEINKEKQFGIYLCNGGEPTYHPQIDEIFTFCEPYFFQLTTNGSRPISWWKDRLKYIDDLAISCHYTEIDKEEFINKIKWITNRRHVTLIFPLYSPVFWEQYEYANRIIKECNNVLISFKTLVSKNYEPEYEYEPGQKEYAAKNSVLRSKYTLPKNIGLDISLYQVFDDGSKKQERPQVLITKGENKFKGWKCWAGVHSLRIDGHGNIEKCSADVVYGNIYDGYKLPTEPEICTEECCKCTATVFIKKEKV